MTRATVVHRRPREVPLPTEQPIGPLAPFRARLLRPGTRPTRHSTNALRATFPRASSSLGRHGLLIGTNLATGNSFAFDPFVLYAAEGADQLSNPNMVVAGGVGQGKSNLTMSYLLRQWLFGRRLVVFSVKPGDAGGGEYDRLAQLIGASLIRVMPGGSVIVNPLDAVFTGDRLQDQTIRPARIGIMAALVETVEDRPLRSDEANALGIALDHVLSGGGQQPTLPQILDAVRQPTDDMRARVGLTVDGWQRQLYELSQSLFRLCHGEYAGLFNGHTSQHLQLDHPQVVFDLEPLTRAGRLAMPMFMAVAASRLQTTLVRQHDANTIVVFEEGWKALAYLGVVRFMQSSWKLARSYGMQNIIVLHRPSDFNAGDTGSEQAALARGLLADTATKVVYRPESQERDNTGQMLALAPDETDALERVGRGEALWRIGDRATLVRHDRHPLEIQQFSTDAGMNRGHSQPGGQDADAV